MWQFQHMSILTIESGFRNIINYDADIEGTIIHFRVKCVYHLFMTSVRVDYEDKNVQNTIDNDKSTNH